MARFDIGGPRSRAGRVPSHAASTTGDVVDAEIARLLAVSLAFGAHAPLRETLRGLAGAAPHAPFVMPQPDQGVWLTVDGDRVVASRRRPEGLATIGQAALQGHADRIGRELRDALNGGEVLAQSARLVRPLLLPAPVASRQAFAALHPWIPALEQIAYKTAASLAVTLDLVRPHLVAALHAGEPLQPGVLADYWQRLLALSQCVLLAADPAARPWLGEMAQQFDWKNWTPSFTLLRERTTWTAACAARSAVAFGETVVESYLATLRRAAHPFKIFDALFGLAAIALGEPSLAPGVAAEVRLVRRRGEGSGEVRRYIRQIYDDALLLMEGDADWAEPGVPEIEALGWTGSPDFDATGLATDLALRTDPAIVTQSGHLLGFVTLPTAVTAPLDRFLPDARALPPALPEETIAAVLQGAWSASPQADRVVH